MPTLNDNGQRSLLSKMSGVVRYAFEKWPFFIKHFDLVNQFNAK